MYILLRLCLVLRRMNPDFIYIKLKHWLVLISSTIGNTCKISAKMTICEPFCATAFRVAGKKTFFFQFPVVYVLNEPGKRHVSHLEPLLEGWTI